MRVVGGVCPSMPMRTPFTPAAPTSMCFCPVAMTVAGRSTTTRAGESRVLSFGVIAPLALISTLMSSVPRTTLTRSSWLGVWAAAATATTRTSIDTNSVSSCFRISPLPTRGPGPRVLLSISVLGVRLPGSPSCLNRRCKDPLDHFPCERLAQLVLYGLREHDRVTRDLHHVAVEYRIVFPQEIRFVQVVGHDRDKAGIGLHDAPQIDSADLQALLPGRTTRSVGLHHRAEERIAFPAHRPLLVFFFLCGCGLGGIRALGRFRRRSRWLRSRYCRRYNLFLRLGRGRSGFRRLGIRCLGLRTWRCLRRGRLRHGGGWRLCRRRSWSRIALRHGLRCRLRFGYGCGRRRLYLCRTAFRCHCVRV